MAIPEGMRRMSVDLPEEHAKALEAARAADGLTSQTRVAAMVAVWVEDESTRGPVTERSRQIAAEKLQRKNAAAARARAKRWPAKDDTQE